MKIATGIIGIVFSFIIAITVFVAPIAFPIVQSTAQSVGLVMALIVIIGAAFSFGLPFVGFLFMLFEFIFGLAMAHHLHGSNVLGVINVLSLIPLVLTLINAILQDTKRRQTKKQSQVL